MNWTQPICAGCYNARYPGREPSRIKEAREERCCVCGFFTMGGIFTRIDPTTVKYPKPEAQGPRYEQCEIELPDHTKKILESANENIRKGSLVYFKWTCRCGSRQTFDEANKFFLEGQCEECDHITDLRDEKANVNYLLLHGDPSEEDLVRLLKLDKEKQS